MAGWRIVYIMSTDTHVQVDIGRRQKYGSASNVSLYGDARLDQVHHGGSLWSLARGNGEIIPRLVSCTA